MNKNITLGIIDCDQLAPELQQEFTCYSEAFVTLLKTSNDKSNIFTSLHFKTYRAIEDIYPQHIDDCDAYLITGSKYSAYEGLAWITTLQSFIQQLHAAKKKIIGICFGHQLIAHSLKGTTTKSDRGWGIGVSSVIVEQKQGWMQPFIKEFSLLVSHQDQVQTLPPKAIAIAGNDFCPNASFQLSEHILSFQGHPEFTKRYSQQLMEKRRQIIGDDKVNQAIGSLAQDTDHEIIAQWILNFIIKTN